MSGRPWPQEDVEYLQQVTSNLRYKMSNELSSELAKRFNRTKASVCHKLHRLEQPVRNGPMSPEDRIVVRRKCKLKLKYGMSVEEYDILWEKQKGVCAICGLPEIRKHQNGQIVRLAVDHCHKTGKVRGLLCSHCNLMLGSARDDINILLKGIQYLGR